MRIRKYINGRPTENDEIRRIGEEKTPRAIADVAESTIGNVRRRIQRNDKSNSDDKKEQSGGDITA